MLKEIAERRETLAATKHKTDAKAEPLAQPLEEAFS
jgi:hypothetical protein